MPCGWRTQKGLYWPPWSSWLSRNPWPAWEERRTWWSRTTWYSWLPWSKSEILVSLFHSFICLLEKKHQAVLHWKMMKSMVLFFFAISIAFRLLSTKYGKTKMGRMEVKIGCFEKSKRVPHNPKSTSHLNKAVSADPFQAAVVLSMIWPSRRVTIQIVPWGCC